MKKGVRIAFEDNVATVLDDVAAGETVEILERDGSRFALEVTESIPFGHKVAVEPIDARQEVTKYGASIGIATKPAARGQYVHTHNLVSKRGKAKGASHG